MRLTQKALTFDDRAPTAGLFGVLPRDTRLATRYPAISN